MGAAPGSRQSSGGARSSWAVFFALLAAGLAILGNLLKAQGVVGATPSNITLAGSAISFVLAVVQFARARSRVGAALTVAVLLIAIALTYVGVRLANGNNLPGVQAMSGGCTSFEVYSQNRYQPYGVLIRLTPFPNSTTRGTYGFAPNQQVWVDGWVHTAQLNGGNRPPYNSDIWFHLSDGRGWVPFAGVREVPTSPDPQQGFGAGGQPAPAPLACRGALQ